LRCQTVSCKYFQFKDLATGELFWQVDAQKGNGTRVAVRMTDLSEAVKELKRLLFRTHRNSLLAVRGYGI